MRELNLLRQVLAEYTPAVFWKFPSKHGIRRDFDISVKSGQCQYVANLCSPVGHISYCGEFHHSRFIIRFGDGKLHYRL